MRAESPVIPNDRTSATPRQGRDSPLFVGSLEKGLRVFQAFDDTHRSLRLTEIAAATGLDKSAAQRFTHTLHELGYLKKDPKTKHYRLAPKVLELGFTYLRTDSLVERATPYLLEANKRAEETVNLTELDGTEVVYVARVPSRHQITVDVVLGTWLPAYCLAPGRAMLAFLPEEKARTVIERSDRASYTEKTVTDVTAIMDMLPRIRRSGYAVAIEEYSAGEISVAAPVFDFGRQPIAAVNIAVPTSRWTIQAVEKKLAPIVVETAQAISHAEGNRTGLQPLRRTAPPRNRRNR
ncbi:MAG: IclR family transcriptional regulator C-terminal domain-containing protein [Alphaproteobacteria bacterium]